MRYRGPVAAAAVFVTLATGCGSRVHGTPAGADAPTKGATPAVTSAATSGLASPASPRASTSLPRFACTGDNTTPYDDPKPNDGPRLPPNFVPAAAYVCFDQQRTYPGDGVWIVTVEQRLEGDLQPLREALLLPDTPTPSASPGVTFACAATLVIRPTLSLVSTTGDVLRPRAPVDFCDDQLPAVDNAVEQLRHVTVSVVKWDRLETQAKVDADHKAVVAGCTPLTKDDFSHGLVASQLSPGGPIEYPAAQVTLCRYRAVPASPPDATFVAARRLTEAQTRRLLAAITLPGKPGGCSRPHDGILQLATPTATLPLTIELGGCSRVAREWQGQSSVGRADPGVVSALMPQP